MLGTNDHRRGAVLYARVSTEEQAKSGYSLAQQIDALKEYASREGYEILEEVLDRGQSGASLGRPGMDRVRDLVAAGCVSVVLAQDRDRFAREPAYTYLLKQEFEGHNCRLRALNDHGGDSPEGQLTDGILDQLAKFEKANIAERTRRGVQQKVSSGRVKASSRPPYGFRFTPTRDGLLVDETKMPVVRRALEMVASGATLYGVAATLTREGVPTPGGAARWSETFIRGLVMNDCYKPHTASEVATLGINPEVAGRLRSDELYGVLWHGRRRFTYEQVAETGPGGERRYRRSSKVEQRPREETTPIPIPGAGVSLPVVEAARTALKGNRRPSRAADREWPLSGGITWCGTCGARTVCHTSSRPSGRKNYYYQCAERSKRGTAGSCPTPNFHKADDVEGQIWQFVSGLLLHPDKLREGLDEMIRQEREGTQGDPAKEAAQWARRLAELDQKRGGYLDLAAEGLMTKDELRTKLAAIEENRAVTRRELEAVWDRSATLERLERDRDSVLEDYARMVPEALESLSHSERQELYKLLRLRVVLRPRQPPEVSGVFAGVPEAPSGEIGSTFKIVRSGASG